MDTKTSEVLIASYKALLDDAKRLISASEVEWCAGCHGTGRIDPIENPPYKCDDCEGRGWTSPYQREAADLRARVEELEGKLAGAKNRTVRRNIVCPRCFEFVEAEVTLGHMVCPACENEVIV